MLFPIIIIVVAFIANMINEPIPLPFFFFFKIIKLEKNGIGYHYILANLVSTAHYRLSACGLSMYGAPVSFHGHSLMGTA